MSGNCHTVMIAHISPADRHWDESRNTLVYADRAKNISNKVGARGLIQRGGSNTERGVEQLGWGGGDKGQ